MRATVPLDILDHVVDVAQHGYFSGSRIVVTDSVYDRTMIHQEAACVTAAELLEQSLQVDVAPDEAKGSGKQPVCAGVGEELVEATVLIDGDTVLGDSDGLCVERGPEEADVAVAGAQGGQTRNLPLDCATRNQHVEELADRSGPSTQSDCLPIGPFARAAELGQTLGATLGNGATAEAEPPGIAAQVEEAEHAANRGRAGRNASRSKMSPELA